MVDVKRVRYLKCPLVEVIFQLRFPTILKIGANPPEEFQEKIQEKYPYFDETIEQTGEINFTNGNPTPINRQNKNYLFISSNEKDRINLTPSFIAITTWDYNQWEDFKEQIEYVIRCFEEIYHPPFYSRIGLRYEDIITRSKLNLEDKDWNDLIEPHILGIMTPKYEGGMISYTSMAEYDNGDNTRVKTHFELVHENNSEENSLLIDCDYFSLQRASTNEMMDISEKLHNHSIKFLGEAIKLELHEAMDPVPI